MLRCRNFQLNCWANNKRKNSPLNWSINLLLFYIDAVGWCIEGCVGLKFVKRVGRRWFVRDSKFHLNIRANKKMQNLPREWLIDLLLFLVVRFLPQEWAA